jgi:Flp pilus assembly protein TadD
MTVAMQLVPEFAWLRITLGEVLMALGRTEEAEGHFQYAVEASRRAAFPLGNHGHCLALLGRREMAEEIFSELRARAASEYVSPFSLALIACGLGDAEATGNHLRRAVDERAAMASYIGVDPRFRAPGMPPLDDLLTRMGLSPRDRA